MVVLVLNVLYESIQVSVTLTARLCTLQSSAYSRASYSRLPHTGVAERVSCASIRVTRLCALAEFEEDL